jgi:hypothetical protein
MRDRAVRQMDDLGFSADWWAIGANCLTAGGGDQCGGFGSKGRSGAGIGFVGSIGWAIGVEFMF